MKKQTVLIGFLILLSGLNVRSQILINTLWDAQDFMGQHFDYYKFGIDTLFGGINQNSLTPWGTYIERGDSISFIDDGHHGCSVNDTGKYTFSIKNNTLKYTVIKDSCGPRRGNLTTLNWVLVSSEFIEANFPSTILLFPNPSIGKFSVISETNQIIGSSFEIFNQLGEEVFNFEISSNRIDINLCGNIKGIYLYQLRKKNEIIKRGKIVIN